MALILRYFTEFMYDVDVKIQFANSSPDEFLVHTVAQIGLLY